MNRILSAGIAVAVLLLLLACSDSPAASSGNGNQGSAAALSLRADAWQTISDREQFPLSNDPSESWVFDFPVVGSINYLYSVRPPKMIAGRLSVSLQITTSAPCCSAT